MPTLKELIDRLQQVASTKVGKLMVIAFVVSSIILGALSLAKWAGILVLDGMWKLIFGFALIVCCLSVAYCIFALVLFKPQPQKAISVENTLSRSDNKEDVGLFENDQLYKWARKIVLTWGIVMIIIVYLGGWIFIWQSAISPLIVQIQTWQWSELTFQNIANLIAEFMIVSLWAVMPIFMYLEYSDKKRKAKKGE